MRAVVVSIVLGLSAIASSALAAAGAPTNISELNQPEPGRVTLQCAIKTDGGLEKCEVLSASDESLGEAAMQLASQISFDPVDADGRSRAGQTIVVPFQIKVRN